MLKGVSRREFIKYCSSLAVALGLSGDYAPKIAAALEEIPRRIPIAWIQAQSCGGCAVSFLNSDAPSPGHLLLDTLSIRFQPNLMATSGEDGLKILEETVTRLPKRYVLVVEGALPERDGGSFAQYSQRGGQRGSIINTVKRMSSKAELIIGLGTCAAFGGIPAAGPTGATGVKPLLGGSVVNVAGCPPHPDWLVGTLVKLQLFGREKVLRDLDSVGRPKEFFSKIVHDACPRRHLFDDGRFAGDWNDPEEAGLCLFKKGCKGPLTSADCPERQWNSRTSWCVENNHPCIGCCEPEFYEGMSPIYETHPDLSALGTRVRPETIGKVAGAATAFGIGGHLMYQVAQGKLPRKKAPKDSTEPTAKGKSGEDGSGSS
ncbi:MAG: hydrogenase small subunit [Terriglobia bacterium]